MGKILTATDYGSSKVVRVVMNPDDPQWIHADGSAAPDDHTGDGAESGKTVCSDCRSNWVIRELVWRGKAITDQALLAEVKVALAAKTSQSITALVDQVI